MAVCVRGFAFPHLDDDRLLPVGKGKFVDVRIELVVPPAGRS